MVLEAKVDVTIVRRRKRTTEYINQVYIKSGVSTRMAGPARCT
jgi:hypothetical protein